MDKELLQLVEINSSALEHNIKQFCNLIGSTKKIAIIVKANAYGHGILEISALLRLPVPPNWLFFQWTSPCCLSYQSSQEQKEKLFILIRINKLTCQKNKNT